MARTSTAKPRVGSRLKNRPPIGARVRIAAGGSWSGKLGTVVAYHIDEIAIVVRLDPQTPLRPFRHDWRRFDEHAGLTFRRRDGDVVIDYTETLVAS